MTPPSPYDWSHPGSPYALYGRLPPSLRRAIHVLGWLILAFFVAGRFWGLPYGDLQDWDEGLYAWRAKAAVVQGEWLDQSAYSYNGFYSGSFPPLLVWKMAGMFSLFGFEEWAARFPSAVMGALALLATYAIGRLLAGHGVGILAACLLGSVHYFLRYSRMAQFDVPYTSWMLIFLAFYLWGMRYPERRRASLALAGAAMGAGLMTKIAIPAFAAINVFLWQVALFAAAARMNDPRWLNPLSPSEFAGDSAADVPAAQSPYRRAARRYFLDHLAIVAVAAVLWLPWHLYMIAKHGGEFIHWYFKFHLIARQQATIDFHAGGWDFYPWTVWDRIPATLYAVAFLAFVSAIVWSAILFAAGKSNAGDSSAEGDPVRSRLPAVMLSLIWIVGLGSILQTAETKREIYLLPIYCHFAVLAAIYLDFWFRRPSRGLLHCFGVLAVFIFIKELRNAGGAAGYRRSFAWGLLTSEFEPPDGGTVVGGIVEALSPFAIYSLVAAAGAVAVVWIAASVRAAWRPHRRQALGFAVGLLLFGSIAYHLVREGRDQFKEEDSFSREIYLPLREVVDDAKAWPKAIFLGTPNASGWPATAHYFYGAGNVTNSTPNRFVEHAEEFEAGMLDPYRAPGCIAIVEGAFGRGSEEASLAMDRELEGFEVIARGKWGVFSVYAYRGEDKAVQEPSDLGE